MIYALALEHTVDKLVEMTLDSPPEPEATPTAPTPLVGTATMQDSDSDSEPAVDIDEYTGEDEDPVYTPHISHDCHMISGHRLCCHLRMWLHPLNKKRLEYCVLVLTTLTSPMTTSTEPLVCGCLGTMRGRDPSQRTTHMKTLVK